MAIRCLVCHEHCLRPVAWVHLFVICSDHCLDGWRQLAPDEQAVFLEIANESNLGWKRSEVLRPTTWEMLPVWEDPASTMGKKWERREGLGLRFDLSEAVQCCSHPQRECYVNDLEGFLCPFYKE